jgi:hypothetical protein
MNPGIEDHYPLAPSQERCNTSQSRLNRQTHGTNKRVCIMALKMVVSTIFCREEQMLKEFEFILGTNPK